MRQRPLLILASVLTILLIACSGVLVADAATPEKIPDGVTIGGVDVGGMTKAAAARKARAELTDRLSKTVKVVHSDKEWNLTARTAGITVNIDRAVAQAAQLSKNGNAFSRLYDHVSGTKVVRDFSPTSKYDGKAITALLNRVEKGLDREPTNASMEFAGGAFKTTDSRVGLRLQRARVAKLVRSALLDPDAKHQISAYTNKIQPSQSSADIRKKYGTVLVANRNTFKLTLYKNLQVSKTYGISVGSVGHDTPAGQYTIGNKAENPSWHVPNSAWAGSLAGTVVPPGPSNPIKARWLGIYDGVGIHGTSDDASIGTNASHGCLRMHVPDVIDLFPRVPVGTPIYIV